MSYIDVSRSRDVYVMVESSPHINDQQNNYKLNMNEHVLTNIAEERLHFLEHLSAPASSSGTIPFLLWQLI